MLGERAGSGRARLSTVVGAGAVVAMLVAGACSSSSDTTASSGAKFSESASAIDGGAPTGASTGAADQAVQGPSFRVDALAQTPAESGRAFISSATMTVQVDDVAVAKPKVVAIAEAGGGGLFAEQTSYGTTARSVLTVKVAPAAFTKALDEIAAVGAMAAQEVKTDDVTQQVVDLDARILAASESLERTRALLAGAKSIGEITQLESEIERRQADLESLKGQRKTLQAKVDLATIVVTLQGSAATPAVVLANTPPAPSELPGFLDGFAGGLRVAANVGTVALAVLGASLPFLPIIVLAWFGLRWLRRRRIGEPVVPA